MSFSFESHLALFGGSFNPPHRGHLTAIQGLSQNPKVDRVMVLPSYGSPLKSTVTSYEHRFQMAKIAFEKIAEVSRFEEEEKTEFTWQVLEKLSTKHPKLAFVIGTDQLEQIHRWARFPEVLSLSDWIVLIRRPKKLADLEKILQKYVTEQVLHPTPDPREFKIARDGTVRTLVLVETEAPEISSTQIREKWSLGQKAIVENLLTPPILSYIERNHLYGT